MENYIRRENNMSEKQMTNDDKIMLLKSQIAEKKKGLKGKKKFSPLTNCSIELDGTRYNLHVSQKELLTNLLIKLNMYRLSVVDLELEDEYIMSGFRVDEWITDIKLKLEILRYEEEDRKLKLLENKLHVLLSNEKQVSLAIEEIESMI